MNEYYDEKEVYLAWSGPMPSTWMQQGFLKVDIDITPCSSVLYHDLFTIA
jgi:hypothetical protein